MITELKTPEDHAILTRTLDRLYEKTAAFKSIGCIHHDPVSLMIHARSLIRASNAQTSVRLNEQTVNIGDLNRVLEAVDREG